MEPVNIAVIEDDPKDREQITGCLTKYADQHKLPFVISQFPDGERFLKENGQYQMVFMDIEMPGRNGIEIARAMRMQRKDEVLILVTNMVQYAIHGYSVRAADYIVKPVQYEQLALKLPELMSMIRRRQKTLMVRNREGTYRLKIPEIRYIEIFNHNILIHLDQKTIECYGTLKDYEKELREYAFSRCSQSCLINLAYVDAISQDMVHLGAELIPLSRREKKNFLSAFTRYEGGYSQ